MDFETKFPVPNNQVLVSFEPYFKGYDATTVTSTGHVTSSVVSPV